MGKTKDEMLTLLKSLKESLKGDLSAELDKLASNAVAKTGVLRKGEFDIVPTAEDLGVKETVLRKADDIYITSKILKVDPRSLKLWGRYNGEMSELRKAMAVGNAAQGADWIPTGFSDVLQRRVRLALKVGALHRWIPMPTSPYTLPIDGADAVAYLIPEKTKDESTKFKASTPGTGDLTFTAKKLAARALFSEDLSEDSIIPILPFVKEKIVEAMKRAIENAIINGDTTATHMDSDVTSSTDFRKAFKGYRRLAYDNNGGTYDAWRQIASTGNLASADLQNIREDMDVYGVDTEGLVWVTSLKGYHAMKNNSDVYTVEKYGPNAVILKGELGRFENIPIVVSEYVRSDLNTSGVYAAGGTYSMVALVHKASLAFGDRRKFTLKTKEEIETDQTILVTTQRLDFKSLQASTYPVVGVLYGV